MICIIRSVANIGSDVLRLAKTIYQSQQDAEIYCVADCYKSELSGQIKELEQLGVKIIKLVPELLEKMGVTYYGSKTGWLCGDYVLYSLLGEEWDKVVLIEPDVFFMNDALSVLLKYFENTEFDLGAYNLDYASEHYYPARIIAQLDSCPKKIGGMLFCVVIATRETVEDAYFLRKKISAELLSKGLSVEINDEVVVASSALSSGKKIFNLRTQTNGLFKYYSYNLRVPIDQVKDDISDPLVMHKALTGEEYMSDFKKSLRIKSASPFMKSPRLGVGAELGILKSEFKDLILKEFVDAGVLHEKTWDLPDIKELISLRSHYESLRNDGLKSYAKAGLIFIAQRKLDGIDIASWSFDTLWAGVYIYAKIREHNGYCNLWIYNNKILVVESILKGRKTAIDIEIVEEASNKSPRIEFFPRLSYRSQEIISKVTQRNRNLLVGDDGKISLSFGSESWEDFTLKIDDIVNVLAE